MRGVLRALRHRAPSSLLVLLIALVAVAAAVVGPTYNAAARTSILHDQLASAGALGSGVEVSEDGPVSGVVDQLAGSVGQEFDSGAHDETMTQRVLQPPIESVDTTLSFPTTNAQSLLAWRTDECDRLHLTVGRCPSQTGEVLVSTSFAASQHVATGQLIRAFGTRPLRVVGIYSIPDYNASYWFNRGSNYFAAELPSGSTGGLNSDALFTTESTMSALSATARGTNAVDLLLAPGQVRSSDLDRLRGGVFALQTSALLQDEQATVSSELPTTIDMIHTGWSSLAVPVIVITAELLGLTWLLLFVIVTDAVEARASEIALVRLRGYSSWRTLRFAVAEPATVLLVSLPIGTALGWLIARALGHSLLRPGTDVPLPAIGWAAAVLATVGGLIAVLVAAQRAVRRPIIQQWQQTQRRGNDRSWVLDAIVATAAVAGIVQLVASGAVETNRHNGLALLVPGLLGLAIAVLASRLLPLACRSAYGWTSRHGGLAGFLAVRWVGRRPGGTRTTMALATALALSTFAILSASVAHANRSHVADVTTGAPTVVTVSPAAGVDLATVVDRIDPSGKAAVAVAEAFNGPIPFLAVQPQRFARVAQWPTGALDRSPLTVARQLSPAAPPPIALNGDAVRVELTERSVDPAGTRLTADVLETGSSTPTPVLLGVVRSVHRPQTLSGQLGDCPCELADLSLAGAKPSSPLRGKAVIKAIEVHSARGWQTAPGLTVAGHWRTPHIDGTVLVTPGGVAWAWHTEQFVAATLSVVDRPDPLPAVATGTAQREVGGGGINGLDGRAVAVRSIAAAKVVPGFTGAAVVVNLADAVTAAGGVGAATQQVWIANGDQARIIAGLRAHNVRILGATTAATVADRLDREGPGLANALFLVDAAAAALLASIGAVVAIAVAARRRRFELASLVVVGAHRRTLRRGVLLEQLCVLGFGAIVGIATGLIAAQVALHSVPEFTRQPAATLLSYRPESHVVVALVVAAAVLVVATSVVVSQLVMRSIDPQQLREAAT